LLSHASDLSFDSTSTTSSTSSSQKRSSKKSKQNKKKSEAASILKHLMSQAEDYGLVKLTQHPSLTHRKTAFINLMDDLADISQTHTDLAQVLADFPNIGSPHTTQADKALFRFLLAKCAPDLRDMLKTCRHELKAENSVEAIRILLQCCAAQNKDEQHHTHQAFVNARLGETESIQSFY
jgi:hypothetical protein